MPTSALPLTIIQGPAAILNMRCHEVTIIPGDWIPRMFRLLEDAQGLGLAAPQVGIDARFFITKWGGIFINPAITEVHNPIFVQEGCLSFPGKTATKRRYIDIGLGEHWYHGIEAIVIQHELDHLNGVTIEHEDKLENGEHQWIHLDQF